MTRKEAIKSYERRNYVLYDGEEKERRMRKKRKRMSKRTNRPFPPKGRKNRLKYSTRSLGGRSRGGDLKEESSSSFPTPRKHRAIREKRNLKAPYHWIPFSLRTSHTSRGTMQCRSNSGTVQLLPDQTSRSREARSLVASVLPVMSRCAIAENGENRRLKSVEYFFSFSSF